jgi:hypothetical protein
VGVSGPVTLTGLLCLRSNDAGEPLIAIPVSLQVRSLRAELSDVRTALTSHSALADKKADRALTDALAALDRALEAANWDDGVRLDADEGRAVFDATIRAVKELRKIDTTWAEDAIDSIVVLGRLIAQVAVDEAPAGHEKDKAIAELARGDAAANPDQALEHYRKAWAFVSES